LTLKGKISPEIIPQGQGADWLILIIQQN